MKKSMTLSVNGTPDSNLSNLSNSISKITAAIGCLPAVILAALRMPVELLRRYFSCCVGHEVSLRQTWIVLRAQAAFVLAVFPTECPLLLRTAFAAWFLIAVIKCRNSGL